ncbi:cell wall hydrolase [Robinsoniella peoriensis]|uniref:cell wall hydrolase n=1 Tax=Robinsoniella peoriensis TaxID=180332 RepID=UPI00114CC697|nr:cell wall hydrolase [Robinsoniella peoriensis]
MRKVYSKFLPAVVLMLLAIPPVCVGAVPESKDAAAPADQTETASKSAGVQAETASKSAGVQAETASKNAGVQAEALKEELQSEFKKLDKRLQDLNGEFNSLEQRTDEKQAQTKEIKKQITDAKKAEKKKRKNMMKRIQMIYESGGITYADVYAASSGIGDFFNSVELVKDMGEYDKKVLQEYRESRTVLKQKKEELKKEQKELESLKNDVDGTRGEISRLLKTASQKLERCEAELKSLQKDDDAESDNITAKNIADELIIKAQKKSGEQLDKEKAEKNAVQKQADEEKALARKVIPDSSMYQPSGNAGQSEVLYNSMAPNMDVSADDQTLLACIIECEAGNQSMEGKVAVGDVVLNRVRSDQFPNTIYGVIYQEGQFVPVAEGIMAAALARGPNASCVEAARQALSGVNYVGNALFFRTNNGRPGQVIGAHVFY